MPSTRTTPRFGRRLFVWFAVATAVPVLLLSGITYLQAYRNLEEDAHRQLHRVAKTVGMYLYAKLEELDQTLGRLHPMQGATAETPGVRRVVQLDASARATARAALTGSTGAVLFALPRPDGGRDVALVPTAWRATLGLRYAALLDAGYLQAPAELLPADTSYCLSDEHTQPVSCTEAPPAEVLEDTAAERQRLSSGILHWSDGADAGLAAYWSVFLRGRFATPDWVVTVSRSEADIYAALDWYRTLFPKVLGLALLLAMLLAFVQLRQRLSPLQAVVDATRRFASGDFSARVAVRGSDELALIGDAFNDMAARTDLQFKRLAGLAELDRLILSSFEEEKIIELTLVRVRELVGARQVSFVSPGDSEGVAEVLVKRAQDDPTDERLRVPMDDAFGSWLNDIAGPVSLAPDQLGALAKEHGVSPTLFPVCHQGGCFGAVLVEWAEADQQLEFCPVLGEFSARLAVALSNAAWEGALYHQAHYDALTGLANRTLLTDRLEQALLRAGRNGTRIAILFIDLDGFKAVNDTLGHQAGDSFLQAAGERLRHAARAADSVVRFGGDEFVVLISDIRTDTSLVPDLTATADRFIRALAEPVEVEGRHITLGASVGIAVYPEDGQTSGDLLRNADAAMYHAKARGRGHAEFYAEQMNRDALERMALQQDLAAAVRNGGDFFLEYQPQMCVASGRITGIEALLRWRHPQRGLISPASFVPLAEETGLIVPLGEWVLRNACSTFQQLRDQGLAIPRLAVNVAPEQFWTPGFFDSVDRVLRDTGVPAEALELEVTEGTVMRDPDKGIDVLVRLSEAGVRLTVDDFGTGYSSLSYLQRLPLHALKIDRSFVDGLGDAGASDAIVAAIVALGKRLGLSLVAEGVESTAQVEALRELGCNEFQGFLFSRPLPSEALEAWVRDWDGSGPGFPPPTRGSD